MDKNTQNNLTNLTHFDKKEMFIKNLRKNLGNITDACNAIKISRQTYYDWKNTDDEFKQECENIPEELLDIAEHALLTEIKDPKSKGHTTAYIFYLKTKGKKRGYDERHQIEISKPFDRIELEDI